MNKEEIIEKYKKNNHIFKVTIEKIFAVPNTMVSHYQDYNDFIKFVNKYPDKVLIQNTHVINLFDEFTKTEEL